jgi:Rrf2 family protein
MKISKKAYYGLRAMTRLAGETEPLSVHVLAEEEGLPEEFLEKIFQSLRKAGIVSSVKGATGGYSLALDSEDITAGHILTVLDGALVPFPCTDGSQGGCPIQASCATQNVWQKLSLALQDTLDGISLRDLVK